MFLSSTRWPFHSRIHSITRQHIRRHINTSIYTKPFFLQTACPIKDAPSFEHYHPSRRPKGERGSRCAMCLRKVPGSPAADLTTHRPQPMELPFGHMNAHKARRNKANTSSRAFKILRSDASRIIGCSCARAQGFGIESTPAKAGYPPPPLPASCFHPGPTRVPRFRGSSPETGGGKPRPWDRRAGIHSNPLTVHKCRIQIPSDVWSCHYRSTWGGVWG